MSSPDPDGLLALLRDPNRETQEIALAADAPREAAARAARMVHGISKAKAEDLRALPPPLALAVLRAASQAGRADLLAAGAGHPSKDVAKEAKRALYLLRSRGVAVPEPPRAPAPAAAPAPEPPVPCFASTVDGQGERALWIGRAVAGKGIEVAQAIVSDVKGLTQLQLGSLGRKEYRLFARDLVERGRTMGVAEIAADEARGLVHAARARNAEAGQPLPQGAEGWLAKLGPGTPPPDLAARFPPLADADERAAVDGSAALHELPLLRGWLADEDELRALAARLDEIAVSPLYLDERQRAEARAAAIAAAVEAHLTPARRERLAARLLAVAAHLDRAGDAGSARIAGAAARALAAGVEGARVPFARMLVEKAFPPEPRATGGLPAGAGVPAAPARGGPLIVPAR